jgi:hypothetical protein
VTQSTVKYQVPHHKDKPYGGAGPVQNADIISNINQNFQFDLGDEHVHEKFVDSYGYWIKETQSNTWIGLDDFPCGVATHGTTEAFDKFYMRNHSRRFRCFRGEYMYHQLTWRRSWPDRWAFLEDADLDANDAVVISCPFADTGATHKLQIPVLAECNRLGVPVLIDCAYFGLCSGMILDVSNPCITDIAFSLSKTFPVAHARIGMRLTRVDDDDAGFVLQKSGYVNRFACGLGDFLLANYSADYCYNQYVKTQTLFCDQLGVWPSPCVIFGIGGDTWQQYNRGTATNRLSFHKYLDQGILPNESGHNI